jgi:hypothetical protein
MESRNKALSIPVVSILSEEFHSLHQARIALYREEGEGGSMEGGRRREGRVLSVLALL